jgi:hypothetical protein
MDQHTVTAHHLLKEEGILETCIYCGRGLDASSWKTSLHLRKHYKVTKCECGKEQKITVPYPSSGHDDWVARTIWLDNLETKIIENEKHK